MANEVGTTEPALKKLKMTKEDGDEEAEAENPSVSAASSEEPSTNKSNKENGNIELEDKADEESSEGDDDLDTSSDSEDDDPLLGWLETVRSQRSVNPKDVLFEQGIIVDKNHLNFIDEEMAWKILTQSVQLFSRHLNSQPRPAPRQRLTTHQSIDHAVELIQNSKKIMVLTGAGISVSCGIPDFRSADGLYKMVEERFELPDPQALFDIHFFIDDPEPFFQFAKELYPGKFEPSASHKFITFLEKRSKLLRNYTQNIDTLEQVAGIERCFECHGSFRTATCFNCKATVGCEDIRERVMKQEIPRCSKCEGDFNILKPDIVFFGEGLPPRFGSQLMQDVEEVDLLIVMGSSLRVRPVCTIPARLPANIPQILINRERVGEPHQFDIELLGNCDEVVAYLCHKLSWTGLPTTLSGPRAEPEYIAPNTYCFEGASLPQTNPSDDPPPNSGENSTTTPSSNNNLATS